MHLGGGAGKAIAGMILSGSRDVDSEVVLLEEPDNHCYYDQLLNNGISVIVTRDSTEISKIIECSDIVVFSWWGHPLMVKLFLNLPVIKCRAIIWNHINGCAYPYLQTGFLNQFDYILFTSDYSMDNPYWSGIEKRDILSKSSLIYGIGNFNTCDVMPKSEYVIKKHFVIGYAGTINYAKMNSRILDYYERVIKVFNDIRVVMIGDPSEEFIEEIRNRGLNEFFIFTGYVDNIFDYYAQMNVFAYLLNENSYATTENSLIEAMAAALPIIVLDNPVENHIIENNCNGIVVKDENDFIEKIGWLRNSYNACRLGTSAREYCVAKYSSEKNCTRFYEICKNLVGSEKKEHSFAVVWGENVYSAFEYQSFKDKELLSKLLYSDACNEKDVISLPYIYKAEDKASIAQFARYFPEESKFALLERRISIYEN